MRLTCPPTSQALVTMPKAAPNTYTETKQTGWNSCCFLLPRLLQIHFYF